MFITTYLRLAGGYHLPSAVDVVSGEKKSEQYFIIYFIFIREKTWGQEI